MMNRLRLLLTCCAFILAACGGGGGSNDSPSPPSQDDFSQGLTQVASVPRFQTIAGSAANVMPISVDANNRMLVSVKVCQEGSSVCQTVNRIMLDTGSVGLRIHASALVSILGGLTVYTSGGGGTTADCALFGNFYAWGPLRGADVYFAGEAAPGLALQVYDDDAVPMASAAGCGGALADAVPAQVGFNGVLGVKPTLSDRQSYFQCSATACLPFAAPIAQQLQNPIVHLGKDNNGYVVELPAIANVGATNSQGALVFGIDTALNNALPASSATIKLDTDNLGLKLWLDGQIYEAIIDSGTGTYALPNPEAMPACSGSSAELYCPDGFVNLAVMMKASSAPDTVITATLTVGNGSSVSASGDGAFNDVASRLPSAVSGYGLGALIGAPFFYGRNIYFAIGGQTVEGRSDTGAFVAF
jgi:hypothetical protein